MAIFPLYSVLASSAVTCSEREEQFYMSNGDFKMTLDFLSYLFIWKCLDHSIGSFVTILHGFSAGESVLTVFRAF